jgi:hypothetical protein
MAFLSLSEHPPPVGKLLTPGHYGDTHGRGEVPPVVAPEGRGVGQDGPRPVPLLRFRQGPEVLHRGQGRLRGRTGPATGPRRGPAPVRDPARPIRGRFRRTDTAGQLKAGAGIKVRGKFVLAVVEDRHLPKWRSTSTAASWSIDCSPPWHPAKRPRVRPGPSRFTRHRVTPRAEASRSRSPRPRSPGRRRG